MWSLRAPDIYQGGEKEPHPLTEPRPAAPKPLDTQLPKIYPPGRSAKRTRSPQNANSAMTVLFTAVEFPFQILQEYRAEPPGVDQTQNSNFSQKDPTDFISAAIVSDISRTTLLVSAGSAGGESLAEYSW